MFSLNLDTKSKNFGIIAGLFRSFLISLTALISRYLIYFNPHEILFYRSLAASFFQIIYLKALKKPYSFRNIFKFEYIIYGSMCCICSSLFIYALKLNSFSEAMILCHTSPIFSYLIEMIYKKNKFIFKEFAYILLTFIGVIIISSSEIDNFELRIFNIFNISFNHSICLLQAALTAIRVEYEKQIATKGHELLLNFASLASYIIYGIIGSFYIGYLRIPVLNEFCLLFFLGFLVIISETLFLKSLKFEKASIMLMIQSSRMFMSFFLEVILLQTYPKVTNIFVSILIYSSIVHLMK